MRVNKYIFLTLIFQILFSQGCSTLQGYQVAVDLQRPAEYTRFYNYLDQAVHKADVWNTSNLFIPGFPYLRANRFLVVLKEKVNNDSQRKFWVQWMRQLDIEARMKEIRNLPESALADLAAQLGEIPEREILARKLFFYSEKLFQHDKKQEGFYEVLKAAINNGSGEYSILMRTLGLYPVFSLPVLYATNSSYNEFRQWHKKPLNDIEVQGQMKVYVPTQNKRFPKEDVSRMFGPSKRNILGIPQLTKAEMEELTIAMAPVFYQDVVDDYDKFGQVVWEGDRVAINYHKPTIYYYVSYSFIKGEPVIQVNYVTWYSARMGPNAPWFERGPLDGMTVRITLDTEGVPIMVDIMNNCGCYHFFVPRKEKVVRVVSKPLALDPLVPAWLPDSFPQERLNLRINSGWHQVQKIYSGEIPSNALSYHLVPYDGSDQNLHFLP